MGMMNIFIAGCAFSSGILAFGNGRIGFGVFMIALCLANYAIGVVTSKCK